jgi:hypothetical protein
MRWNTYLAAPGLALVLIVIGVLALAQSPGAMMRHGSTTDGPDRAETTDDGMQGCVQMMQGMHAGGNHRPNEQWRQQ